MTAGQVRGYRGVFLGVAIVAVAYLAWFIRLLQRARASRTWPSTEGRILSAQAQNLGRGRGSVLVYYEYVVNGRQYRGKRLRFAPWGALSFDDAKADVLKYRPTCSIQIHYNPAVPNDSVIELGVVPSLWLCIAGSAAFGALALTLYFL